MTIEDIIRKIIKEEISALAIPPVIKAVIHEEKPAPEEVSDFFEEPENDVVVNDTTELLEYLKANCTPVQAKRAKAVVVDMGYERVSLVPDSRAQAVLDKVLIEVFN